MITDRRLVYAPFEYDQADEYWLMQHQAHWLPSEISMAGDIQDWNISLSPSEKNVIGSILKGFTQVEVIVNDYWSRRVSKWFPKPEIVAMASAFADMETIHAHAYALLNESLGLDNFSAFLSEPTTKDKLDTLIEVKGTSNRDIARSLAIFSGFAEGVQLFSSFAVLMNFSRFNKLKGVGQIVAFSVKDETLHSNAGCWLFRQLVKEYPDLWDRELKQDIYDAARNTIKLEDAFIDKAFELGAIEGLTPYDLKQFIRFRCNTKLSDLGLGSNWKNINIQSLENLAWFDYLTTGVEHQDFFAGRVSSYSKGVVSFDDIFED